jgi:hypothetical protein
MHYLYREKLHNLSVTFGDQDGQETVCLSGHTHLVSNLSDEKIRLEIIKMELERDRLSGFITNKVEKEEVGEE